MGCENSNPRRSKKNTLEFEQVQEQNMLMDNNEVRVMQIEGEKFKKTAKQPSDLFDGYLQRRSYFVIPQIDKLRKEKLELKQNMMIGQAGKQNFSKFMVTNAGEELSKKGNLYYVSVI